MRPARWDSNWFAPKHVVLRRSTRPSRLWRRRRSTRCSGLTTARSSARNPTPARIFALLASLHLPSVSDEGNFAEEGGLLSLGVDDLAAVARGGADYIDRILKGAKVAELPVVLPSKFTLGVNLKTAEQLGITIPPSILPRADEVIE